MLERTRSPRREELAPGGGSANLFPADEGGLVTVSHGLHVEQLPVGNLTVGEIRSRFADRFDIDPDSRAQVDGQDADENTVVRTGQNVMFVRFAGEKGLRETPLSGEYL